MQVFSRIFRHLALLHRTFSANLLHTFRKRIDPNIISHSDISKMSREAGNSFEWGDMRYGRTLTPPAFKRLKIITI